MSLPITCFYFERLVTTIQPNFAIMAAGFRSGSLVHLNYYEEIISIPTLHIYGESDAIISPDMSESLANIFDDPKIVTHPGGHYFAASSSQKPTYIEFIQDRLVEYLEEKELAEPENESTIFVKPSANRQSSSDDSD